MHPIHRYTTGGAIPPSNPLDPLSIPLSISANPLNPSPSLTISVNPWLPLLRRGSIPRPSLLDAPGIFRWIDGGGIERIGRRICGWDARVWMGTRRDGWRWNGTIEPTTSSPSPRWDDLPSAMVVFRQPPKNPCIDPRVTFRRTPLPLHTHGPSRISPLHPPWNGSRIVGLGASTPNTRPWARRRVPSPRTQPSSWSSLVGGDGPFPTLLDRKAGTYGSSAYPIVLSAPFCPKVCPRLKRRFERTSTGWIRGASTPAASLARPARLEDCLGGSRKEA
eukprot:scaffold25_cov342-Pavlova_lutheri.AAC.35